jgi:hypothetical protein
LDVVEVKLGKYNESNDTSIDNSDDEIYYENHRINETLSSDEIEGEEDDYNLEREDL